MNQPIAYLEWIAGRPEAAAHDLGSSDLQAFPQDSPLEALDGFPDPPAETTLEEQLADVYAVRPDQIHVTAGATHANLLVMATALQFERQHSQDRNSPRVLVETPGYEPLVKTPIGLGAEVDRIPRGTDGQLDPDTIVDAADDGSVDLITLTNRHNPSGTMTDRETLASVADIASQIDAFCLVDEVYAPYAPTSRGERGFGGVTATGLPNTVVTGSFTKFHGLGGLRIGWVVGPAAFVDRLSSVAWYTPVVADTSRALGRRALFNAETIADQSRDLIERNHDLLSSFVDSRTDLTGTVPDGCPFATLACTHADGDRVTRVAWEQDLLVIPGRFFDAPERIRISLGGQTDEMKQALDVLGSVLDSL